MRIAVAAVAATAVIYVLALDWVFAAAVGWSTPMRLVLSAAIAGPLAFFMGWPFPGGLAAVRLRAPARVPWAWGVNGFASVAGAPIAVLLSVSFGFSRVMLLAAALYLAAGAVCVRLTDSKK